MFSKAKVGDRVFSVRRGWGTIERVEPNCPFELIYGCVTDADDCVFWFTVNGKEGRSDLLPSVFWGEPKFEIPERPIPELEVDTKVLVRMSEDDPWVNRYFHSFDEEGKLCTWAGGSTKYSAANPNYFISWNFWKLYDEEKKQ